MTTGIAGSGRVAQALGRCLQDAGERIDAVSSRSIAHARIAAEFIGGACQPVPLADLHCDRILIAVSDRAIVHVADGLSGCQVLLHTSGVSGGDLLAKQQSQEISCGSIHPFQTISTPGAGFHDLPGSAFAVDGDPEALAWAEEIVHRLQGVILRIPNASRAIYHAAAAMASNHVIAILDASSQLLQLAGIGNHDILRAIGSISRTSLRNTIDRGPLEALTGPVERGDTETVSRHLKAIASASESVQHLYRAASLQALDIAVRRGMNSESASSMQALLIEDAVAFDQRK